MTTNAAKLDAEDTFNDKNVPIPIPTYEYTVINRSLLCDCQMQRGNEFYVNL